MRFHHHEDMMIWQFMKQNYDDLITGGICSFCHDLFQLTDNEWIFDLI